MKQKHMRRVLIRIVGLKSWHPACVEQGRTEWGTRYWLEEKDRTRLPKSRHITDSSSGPYVPGTFVEEVRELGQRLEF